MNTNADRAKSIFLDAAEIASPDERREFVDAQCGSDTSIRQEVDELLRHYQVLGNFLESPPAGINGDGLLPVDEPLAEGPGTVIGHYKLLQQIGEGGMGVVFMAEQECGRPYQAGHLRTMATVAVVAAVSLVVRVRCASRPASVRTSRQT